MPKLIDLTNKTFGKLTVIKRHPQNSRDNRPRWICKCDCGKDEVIVLGANLRSGHTTSCGCYHKSISGQLNFKDIAGQKFGKLTAINYSKTDERGNAIWLCECECGNHIEVSGINLRKGHTRSCGCIKSFGEAKIQHLLEENNITFQTQKMFDNCRFPDTQQMARFDFFIDGKYLIEYDGQQHFGVGGGWGDIERNYEKIKFNDEYKNLWCKENNIPLIRIPYTAYSNLSIEDIILEKTKYRVA